MPGKRVCKDFEKNLGEHHDFYVQNDTLLLVDVFEHFRNTWLEIYGLIMQNFFQLLDYKLSKRPK